MGVKEKLNEIRAELIFNIRTASKKSEFIEIKSIPKTWEKFMNTEDEWICVDLPESENATSCMYKAKKGSIFNVHKHRSIEMFHIINKGGKLKSLTRKEIKTIKYPNGISYEAEEDHMVEFLEDTTLFITWTPGFENGWDAYFKQES